MADWGWVALGYGVAYGSMLAYLGLLVRRHRRVNRDERR